MIVLICSMIISSLLSVAFIVFIFRRQFEEIEQIIRFINASTDQIAADVVDASAMTRSAKRFFDLQTSTASSSSSRSRCENCGD